MNEILNLLVRHGIAILFAVEFIEQVGIPLPAAPWLLAAGALVGVGKMNWWMALFAAALGSLLGDLIWFFLGRYYGNRVLGLLCRISQEPDSCARRTQNLFTRYGMPGLIVAKFIPGLGTLAPPLAGNSGVATARFIFFDGLSSVLHGGCFILVGVLFSHQLEQIINALAGLGRSSFVVFAGLAALYIAYKYFQRHRLLSELRMARITVEELYQKQEAGEYPMILDLRQQVELELDPSVIRGALRMNTDEIEHLVMFPHGAQKALGWFGGYGFSGTMNFLAFTEKLGAFCKICKNGIIILKHGHPVIDALSVAWYAVRLACKSCYDCKKCNHK